MNKPYYDTSGNLLDDKIILITGAGDGIGKAVATHCAKQNARVILLDKNLEELEHTYDEIINTGGAEPLIYQCDLNELDELEANKLVGGIYNEFGRLDGLLHNAAFLGTITLCEQFDLELWLKVFQVNVHAAFILNKHCLPLLKKSQHASIVFTGANAGLVGNAYWGAYSASKFANEGMMQTLADELMMEKIRVNLIDPGAVATKMRALAFPAEDPSTLSSPQSMTHAYLYLLSDDSLNITCKRLDAWHK